MLVTLPFDLNNQIISSLGCQGNTLCRFALTSKAACKIIREIAQSKLDINLDGKEVEFPYDEDTTTLKTCIFHIIKIQGLQRHPEVLSYLSDARERVVVEGQDPNNLNLIIAQALSKSGLGCGSSHYYVQTIKAIIPFDFHTPRITGYMLSEIFVDSVLSRQIDFAHLILCHPGSKNISADQLGKVLYETVRANDLDLTCRVLALPTASKIKTNPDNFLTEAAYHTLEGSLVTAIKVKNPKIIRKIVSHPNAKDIPLERNPGNDRDWGLTNDLDRAVKTKDPRVIAAVLSHPRIIKLPEADLYKAGRVVFCEDIKPFRSVKQMLENGKPSQLDLKELGKAFICMSYELQRFLYLMLCKTHGCPTGNIKKDGMVHLLKHSHSLLPIMKKLTAEPWTVAIPDDDN